MNISFKKNINKFKKGVNFLLTISGGVFLLYFFYKDILLKKSRIFKSCPYNAFQVNLNSNQKTSNNLDSEFYDWMDSNKLLIRNPKTNRCERLKYYHSKQTLSNSLLRRINNNKNIREIISNNFVILNFNNSESGMYPIPNNLSSVDCPKTSFAIAYFGQSNSANSVDSKSKLRIPENLYQYNWRDNKCYKFNEPLLGASGEGGNTITYFAVNLAKSTDKNLLIIPYGIGGTYIESWNTGYLGLLNEYILEKLKQKNINVDLFLFHQGEANSYLNNFANKISKAEYSKPYLTNILNIIDKTRLYFPESFFGLALVSRCGITQTNYLINNSQNKVPKNRYKTFISADSDSIFGDKYRYDNCHFNQKGVKALGQMYEESFKKNIFNY